MIWLLTEILVFVAAAAVFGAVIGLGLAGSGGKRRTVAVERETQELIEKAQGLERTQRLVEGQAVARAAAEAAARGDLEVRLVEMEQAAADYRARAEAAERRLHLMDAPAAPAEVVEAVLPGPPEGGASTASSAAAPTAAPDPDAIQARQEREIESLKAQLARAERVRARAEIDLAVAHARPEATRALHPQDAGP